MSFLSPLDLLTLSAVEQDVVRCLAKHPIMTMAEIASVTNIALEKLDKLLPQMVAENGYFCISPQKGIFQRYPVECLTS